MIHEASRTSPAVAKELNNSDNDGKTRSSGRMESVHRGPVGCGKGDMQPAGRGVATVYPKARIAIAAQPVARRARGRAFSRDREDTGDPQRGQSRLVEPARGVGVGNGDLDMVDQHESSFMG